MKIKKLNKLIISQKALGLVEALISLAVVATGMVIITSLSLKTLKVVRKNELQDIAVQIGVEAMDFMKQPASIRTVGASGDYQGYYYVNLSDEPYGIVKTSDLNEIDSCSPSSNYHVSTITETDVCQQVYVGEDPDGSNRKFFIKTIIVWETVGSDEHEKKVTSGIRQGKFKSY